MDGAIPATDLHSNNETQELPHSIEAEQAVLGALLVNNEVYDRIASIVKTEHFYDPVHGRIFEVISGRIKKNALASPVTVKAFMMDDPGLAEIGGPSYLARLAAASVSVFAARDYAHMIYDCAIRRDLIILGQEISDNAAAMNVETEAKDQITDAEQRLYTLSEQGSLDKGFQAFIKPLSDAVKVAANAYQRDGRLSGLSTGFQDLDTKLGGLHDSDLLILAGRPSMGKTALATNIAFQIVKAYKKGELEDGTEGTVSGGVVGFFSLEMSSEQLASRIISEASEVESHRIRTGRLTEDEFRRFVEASKVIENCPLFIDDTPALSIAQIAARARRLKRTHGLDVLILDYLQLARSANARDNRVYEVSEITQGLKAIAKELEIPVIALSQLSRQVESRDDKRPQLSDLRESGSIEQDADCVMFVYREEYYKEREKPAENEMEKMAEWQTTMESVMGKAEVIIGKQRHGPTGSIELQFDGKYTRFSNLAKHKYGSTKDDEI